MYKSPCESRPCRYTQLRLLQRARVWSSCSWRVVAEERNYWTAQFKKCWHPLSMWHNCYSMTMDAIYEEHKFYWSQQVSAVVTNHWLQVRPGPSSLWRVCMACKTSTTRPTCYICTWYDIEGSYDKIKIHKYHLFVAFSIVNHAAHTQQYRQHQTHDIVLYHGDTYMDRCSSD